MRGEKIYEFDFDITGVTDYGVSMDAILAGKERFHCKEPASTLRLRGAVKDAFRGGRTASTIRECVLMVVSTLTCT
jgi:hypothetical protein